MVNGIINNEYVVKEDNNDIIRVRPKLAGGSETKVLFQNVSGMVTNHKNRHKMKVMHETMKVDAALITETACTKKEKIWTCDDEVEVV